LLCRQLDEGAGGALAVFAAHCTVLSTNSFNTVISFASFSVARLRPGCRR
jgi:hypothetical protein